jgi:hypothetical protein
MGDCALVQIADYDRARRCVNALAGMNSEAVAELVWAANNIHFNARLAPDPLMEGTTDCYIVPLDDVLAVRAALAALEVER